MAAASGRARRTARAAALLVPLTAALGSGGCSSRSEPIGFGDGGEGGSGSDDSGMSLFDGGDAGCTGDNGANDSTCAQKSQQTQCIGCCQTDHKCGFLAYRAAALGCICTSPGPCKTQCANEFCAGVNSSAGDACSTCINSAFAPGATCDTQVKDACNADPGCPGYLQCIATEKCSSKP